MVHEFGAKHDYVRYIDRFGRELTAEVQWPDWNA
jgi:hypothetical protein